MKTIQLLKPEHESCTEPLQVCQWPVDSETAHPSPEQIESIDEAIQWDALEMLSDDRSMPRPVYFVWQGTTGVPNTPVYDLHMSTDRDFKEPRVITNIAEPCWNVLNLHIDTRYFWKVIAKDGNAVVAQSSVREFTTHASAPRCLHVAGITNVRDLGGWRLPGDRCIRQGLMYRSSEMNGHIDISDVGRQVLIDQLKIRTDLDLRGSSEEPQAALDPSLVKWVNIPIGPYEGMVANETREKYRQIFKLFSDPSQYPILFHCWGGCDRAGTLAFLLHALLGLDRDALIRDYEWSSLSIWGKRSHESDEFQSLLSTLRSFGDQEDDVGRQVETYLCSIGVTAEEIASIRTHLTTETDK